MKKLLLTLILLPALLCGCANVESQFTINKDKSASLKVELNYDQDINDNSAEALTIINNYKKIIDSSYDISEDDNKITAAKSVNNIEKADMDFSSLGFTTNSVDGKFVDVKKNFFVTSYNIDMYYNLPKVIEEIDVVEPQNTSKEGLKPEYLGLAEQDSIVSSIKPDDERADFVANYENNFNVKPIENKEEAEENSTVENQNSYNAVFSINVPSFASYNNADSSELTTYYWNIKKDTPTLIRFQYVVYNGFAITFIILAGMALLIYVARRILRHDNQKRIGNRN